MENDILSTFYPIVRELVNDEPLLEKIFVVNRVSSVLESHDNWNGGIDYFSVSVPVPVSLYKKIGGESRVKDCENEILKAFSTAMKGIVELDVSHINIVPYVDNSNSNIHTERTVKAWIPGYFRMFISHLSSDKKSAANLKIALAEYGISGFVAHEDIAPTTEWQEEIIAALRTMDALCANLTAKFHESFWCDQEVGFGLGRGILCIAIRHGSDPYGLFGRYQGVNASKDAHEVANSIFKILYSHDQTRIQYIQILSNLFLNASSNESALKWLNILNQVETLSNNDVNYIRTHISDSNGFVRDESFLRELNVFFRNYGIEEFAVTKIIDVTESNDLPF